MPPTVPNPNRKYKAGRRLLKSSIARQDVPDGMDKFTRHAWEGRKMSDIKLDEFRNQAAEEEFLRLAALEIDAEQNEAFVEAQSLPDPPPEVLQRMQQNLQATMRQTRKKKRRHTIFLYLGRFTACAAAICCVMFSGVYLGVDAARNSINNFVLELFDGHAVIRTEASEPESGAALPVDWQGPFYVTWVPARFTHVKATELDTNYTLLYTNETSDDYFSIFVWSSFSPTTVNTEGMELISEENILQAPAQIYFQQEKSIYMLLWTKNDYIIQIYGNISAEESKEIAESFEF